MAFTFEITQVNRLAWARIGVLDGKLLDGKVLIGDKAQLEHDGQFYPLRVKGIALESVRTQREDLSLTVDLRDAGMKVATVGDKLIGC
jgi:hypothetical protein